MLKLVLSVKPLQVFSVTCPYITYTFVIYYCISQSHSYNSTQHTVSNYLKIHIAQLGGNVTTNFTTM